ncbi:MULTISPECIES: hypothetical protein [Prauserella salsuginis group]|uniref:Uncharacterized protein n=2 Tax=Prauserella salsuginis group TaxID=2893672 RepID=A0A839XV04_9PSEU|nr:MULTISPECIES: hypothetical protein [Prauserella salsuginis group]MBB3665879.1 hypothetical protein [Prauserella sediminis]MCR3718863.1 hypothetical protein [Prauserella flava]MCR3733433.1 hypothetical protein [Prauserella salsuginis]
MDIEVFLLAMLIVAVVVSVPLVIALTRKGSVATVPMTKRRQVVRVEAAPEHVYAWITQRCPAGFAVVDTDPGRGLALLDSRMSLATWGFFYPVLVTPEPAGTRVEIGIKSKAIQYGPLVTRQHRKLADALATLTHGRVEAG